MKQTKNTLIGIFILCLTLFIYAFFLTMSSATAGDVFIGLSSFLFHATILLVRIFTNMRYLSDLIFPICLHKNIQAEKDSSHENQHLKGLGRLAVRPVRVVEWGVDCLSGCRPYLKHDALGQSRNWLV